jgi:hypothetical protein
MLKAMTLSALVMAGLLSTPLAHADPASDQYDQFMISHGVVGDGPTKYTEEFTLQAGTNACAALREGKSESFLMRQLIDAYQMDQASSSDIVYAAHHYLCPDA